jgi:hypothetical protein
MLTRIAPLLAMLPELRSWSRSEREALVRVVRAKAARSEVRACRLLRDHPRLEEALRTRVAALAPDPAPEFEAP